MLRSKLHVSQNIEIKIQFHVEKIIQIKKTKMNVDILPKTYYQCYFCIKYITVESSKRNENILIVSFKIEIKLMGKRYLSKLMIIYIQS